MTAGTYMYVSETISQNLTFVLGTFDVNSRKGPVLPWLRRYLSRRNHRNFVSRTNLVFVYLRSIDAFNTHDDALQLAIAGGVTSVQTLPGSGNAIGGQAFMMKLRKTQERSPTSMLLEPPHNLNGSSVGSSSSPRWRHMKYGLIFYALSFYLTSVL